MKRKYRTAEQWLELFKLFEQSNLNITDFCRQHNLSSSCFYAWRKRCASIMQAPETEVKAEPKPSDEWQQIVPPSINDTLPIASQPWDIELSLPNGVTLRMRQ